MTHFLILFALLLLLLLNIPAVSWIQIELALKDPGRVRYATAYVTEYQIDEHYSRKTGHSIEYEVRYQFQVPGDSQWYSYRDTLFGGENLWKQIKRSAWEYARQHGNTIEVLYLPENPWANQPVDETTGSQIAVYILLAAGALVDLLVLVQVIVMVRNYFRCKKALQRGEVCRMRYWQVKQT